MQYPPGTVRFSPEANTVRKTAGADVRGRERPLGQERGVIREKPSTEIAAPVVVFLISIQSEASPFSSIRLPLLATMNSEMRKFWADVGLAVVSRQLNATIRTSWFFMAKVGTNWFITAAEIDSKVAGARSLVKRRTGELLPRSRRSWSETRFRSLHGLIDAFRLRGGCRVIDHEGGAGQRRDVLQQRPGVRRVEVGAVLDAVMNTDRALEGDAGMEVDVHRGCARHNDDRRQARYRVDGVGDFDRVAACGQKGDVIQGQRGIGGTGHRVAIFGPLVGQRQTAASPDGEIHGRSGGKRSALRLLSDDGRAGDRHLERAGQVCNPGSVHFAGQHPRAFAIAIPGTDVQEGTIDRHVRRCPRNPRRGTVAVNGDGVGAGAERQRAGQRFQEEIQRGRRSHGSGNIRSIKRHGGQNGGAGDIVKLNRERAARRGFIQGRAQIRHHYRGTRDHIEEIGHTTAVSFRTRAGDGGRVVG